MNNKIKILTVLNLISYIVMIFTNLLVRFVNINNLTKLIIGSLPLVLIVSTSFIMASDAYLELKIIKKEAVLDWITRIVAFIISLYGIVHYLYNSYLLLILIFILFITNCIIEYRMNKKLQNSCEEKDNKIKIEISYKEKCNLKNMVKSVNLGMISYLIFCGFSLSVATSKNMEGAEDRSYIPVIVSALVALWFIKISYENYMNFYLDKKYAKNIFIKNSTFALIGYLICISLSFVNFEKYIYDYIIFIGILFAIPTINTMRKMALRLRDIRSSLGKEDYNYFITKEK